jgi:hypothetical protein
LVTLHLKFCIASQSLVSLNGIPCDLTQAVAAPLTWCAALRPVAYPGKPLWGLPAVFVPIEKGTRFGCPSACHSSTDPIIHPGLALSQLWLEGVHSKATILPDGVEDVRRTWLAWLRARYKFFVFLVTAGRQDRYAGGQRVRDVPIKCDS